MSAPLVMRVATLASDLLEGVCHELALAGAVCALVWLLCRVLGRRAPALQQALWMLVLLRLVLPPGLAAPYSAGALLQRWGWGYQWSEKGDAATAWLPAAGERQSAASAHVPTPPRLWAMPVLTVWALCVVALLGRDGRRLRFYRRVLREASPVRDPRVLAMCDAWRLRLGIRRRVRLVASHARVAPFTTGLLRPVIFLPSALLAEAGGRGRATALSHELGHVSRMDCLWMRLEQIVERLYFFHPAVWLAAARLRAGREGLCDALVVSSGLVHPREYVHGLLDVLALDLRPLAAAALTPTQRRITTRVRTVLAVTAGRRPRPALVLAAALAIGCFLLPLASARTTGTPNPMAPPPAPHVALAAPESSTLHWAHGLANPLPSGLLRSGFGRRPDPITGQSVFHQGLDISAPFGTPILAPADGRVVLAREKGAFGNALVLEHSDGVATRFAHMKGYNVREGQQVRRGDVIAFVGASGRSLGGPHLHYEVWIRDEARNPVQ